MSFSEMYEGLGQCLVKQGKRVVEPPHQMTHLRTKPEWTSIELVHVVIDYKIPDTVLDLTEEIQPNLPWAETHFQERVSGIPHNPPPSHSQWPYARSDNEEHRKDGKFSHTYPERMWPKWAGTFTGWRDDGERDYGESVPAYGVHFDYGDLNDLVALLIDHPHTRQAYLPIWFPEDLTAANLGERVPCTLGYHFLMRENKLNLFYPIRSCDLVRFFRDDVYMACRLAQWVLMRVRDFGYFGGVELGTLTMHIVSLHCFEGDLPHLRRQHEAAGA